MYVGSQVDAVRLRSTLDGLRNAIATGGPVPTAHATASTIAAQSQLLAALNAVLGKATKDDLARLSERRSDSALGRTLRDPALEERLNKTLHALSKATRVRLDLILSREKIVILGKLLQKPVPDFLTVVQKRRDENAHSDVIKWLLSPRKALSIARPALLALVAKFENADEWRAVITKAIESRTLAVRREYVFGREWEDSDELSRLDLFISGPGFAIAIENKVTAQEYEKQTTKYWQWLSSLGGLRAGIFLTPNGRAAQSSAFRSLSYLELLAALLEGPVQAAVSQRTRRVGFGQLREVARRERA